MLAEHDGIIEAIHTDAGWARAAADYAAAARPPGPARDPHRRRHHRRSEPGPGLGAAGRVPRLVRPRGASPPSRRASRLRRRPPAHRPAELVAHLLAHPEATALAGAELVVGAGWLGLRSHPRPIGSITYGGPAVPEWLDATLREVVGRTDGASHRRVRMTARPTRVVDAHVHLWDPARTDWYPVPVASSAKAAPVTRRGCTAASMSTPTGPRRPGGTSRSSSTSPPPPVVTPSRRPSSSTPTRDASGRPDAIIGGLPPTDTVAEAVELIDRQMAASTLPWGPPDGRHRWGRSPTPACSTPWRSGTWCSS